jgi:hypothetical protein
MDVVGFRRPLKHMGSLMHICIVCRCVAFAEGNVGCFGGPEAVQVAALKEAANPARAVAANHVARGTVHPVLRCGAHNGTRSRFLDQSDTCIP